MLNVVGMCSEGSCRYKEFVYSVLQRDKRDTKTIFVCPILVYASETREV